MLANNVVVVVVVVTTVIDVSAKPNDWFNNLEIQSPHVVESRSKLPFPADVANFVLILLPRSSSMFF